jgi:hypothetical protein
MKDLQLLSLTDLLDLLTEETTRYVQMISRGARDDEFQKCKELILRLQTEIERRKNNNPTDAIST